MISACVKGKKEGDVGWMNREEEWIAADLTRGDLITMLLRLQSHHLVLSEGKELESGEPVRGLIFLHTRNGLVR